jgi:hypothetical protein
LNVCSRTHFPKNMTHLSCVLGEWLCSPSLLVSLNITHLNIIGASPHSFPKFPSSLKFLRISPLLKEEDIIEFPAQITRLEIMHTVSMSVIKLIPPTVKHLVIAGTSDMNALYTNLPNITHLTLWGYFDINFPKPPDHIHVRWRYGQHNYCARVEDEHTMRSLPKFITAIFIQQLHIYI